MTTIVPEERRAFDCTPSNRRWNADLIVQVVFQELLPESDIENVTVENRPAFIMDLLAASKELTGKLWQVFQIHRLVINEEGAIYLGPDLFWEI